MPLPPALPRQLVGHGRIASSWDGFAVRPDGLKNRPTHQIPDGGPLRLVPQGAGAGRHHRPHHTAVPTSPHRLSAGGPGALAPAPSGGSGSRASPLAGPAGPSGSTGLLAVGADAGSLPLVRVLDAATGRVKFSFFAYVPAFRGVVRVAVGDVNGDGTPDIITAPGPGGGSVVKVFDGKTGQLLSSFNAYNPGQTNGVYVAAGDVNGDGHADIITGTDAGSAPLVKVFSGTDDSLLASFLSDPTSPPDGVRVAAGDVQADGHADIITGAGPGGPPRVCVFDGVTDQEIYDFLASDMTFHGGVYVAAGDLNGDGKADLITGLGAGGPPEVQVYSGADTSPLGSFLAYDLSFAGGVRVAATDANADGQLDIVTAPGPGGGQVRAFDGRTQQALTSFSPFGGSFQAGLFVGGDARAAVTVPVDPLAVVTVTATTADTNDAGAPAGVFTFSRTGDTSSALAVYYNFGGTAVINTDYTPNPPSGTLIIPAGAASTTLTITPLDDHRFEDLETVVATLLPSSQNQYIIGRPGSAVVTIHDMDGPPPIVPGNSCGCGDNPDAVQQAPGVGANPGPAASDGPVRYFDGTVQLDTTDLSSAGFGVPWGQDRSWTNGPGYAASSTGGSGTVVTQLPYLRQDSNNSVAVISNGTTARTFDLSGGTYHARFFLQETLADNTGAGEFLLTDTAGNQLCFYDFSTSVPAAERGLFKSLTDPHGNVTSVVSRNSSGQPTEVQRSNTTGGVTVVESYLYSYLSTGPNTGLLANVTLRRQVNGGAWSTVRQATYTYYDGTQSYGNQGDLMTAVVQDGAGNTLDSRYFRYYTPGQGGGYVHGLRYLFGPQSYARLVAALGTNVSSLTDAQVAPYADLYLEYDAVQEVTKETVQGAGCSSCSGGLGTYTFAFTTSSFPDGYNTWRRKTAETLPDGNQNIVYTNAYGEVMLKVYHDAASGLNWETFFKYDNSGREVWAASPSAVTGYDDTTPDLLNNQSGNYQYLSDTTGLVTVTDYGASTTATGSTAGDVTGYYKDTKLYQGEPLPANTGMLQQQTQYFSQTGGGTTIYPVATQTVYRNTDGTGAETTSYSYVFFSNSTQVQSLTVSLPVISAAQNGPGTADTSTTVNDIYGRPIWTKNADGFINYVQYDQATGAVVKTITDVDATKTGDFLNLPSGWTTPTGGGLHLITTMQVDGLGRTTKLTDPDGNVTYTVYKDTNYEARVYPGWNSSTNMPTGPTQMYREDRPGSYTETLTMSAAPHLTNGVPDGTEAVSNIQSLSRSYTNSAGQLVRRDDYFNLSGVTYSTAQYLGTQNTNYYTTLYGYDERGRQNRVQLPTGTIQRTVYDGLGRVVSTWVGTSDTPGSGYWSPTNNTPPANMVQVMGNVYDGGGVGDSNLTQQTQYPGGGAANRVAQSWYDWRDRLVATKQGVQGTEDTTTHRPILYLTLDNLGEVTQQQQYDGDGVTLTSSNGVPQPPSASLLRAQTNTAYDDQSRTYQAQVFSVNPTTGAVSSTALTTNSWFNHRGFVIATSQPGGLVLKTAYDGAGRATVQYTSDGASGTTWTAAGSVSGDNVLSQVEQTYDADGNVLLTTDRERFHNETATGALGNPTMAPKARVSYVADYYDLASRLTTMVNVGTNGGITWTRPATPPAPSDTVLVTSSGYAGDSVQQVQLTGNPTGGTFTLSFNGQTTAPIAYNASAATVQAALQALSSIGSGNALVANPTGAAWVVRFAGTLGGAAQPALTANGSGLTGGTSPSVAITVTSLGGDAGRVQQTTDPRGIVTKTDDDWLGRTLRTVEAFSGFAPSNNTDKTTEYSYDGDGHLLTLQADLVGGAYQQTKYVYGVTTAGGSGVNSNDLLAAVQYPDPATGNPSSSQQESYTVNALGQTVTMTDRNGNVHTYTLDVLGRVTSDAITTLGAGVDGAVRRIETAYDTQGNAYLFTSYDAPAGGNIVNQVQRAFNGLGQLTQEWQSHSGAVNTSTTPSVQYGHSLMAGGANHSRLTSITYPNGKVLNYNYNAGLDNSISRLSSLSDSGGTLEGYLYLGLGTVVQRAHPQPGVNLTYIQQTGDQNANTDGGDQYTGLDRFGRLIDQFWLNTGTSTANDRFLYGYDRDSNRLYRNNLVNTSFGELYHASGAGNGYDNLNQLQAFSRGVLSASQQGGPLDTIANPSHSQSWAVDAAGNFSSVTTDGTAQNNAFNKQNEQTQAGAANLTFDANGNTTTDDNGHTLLYDAWNRLVTVKSGSTVLESYKYDGLGRRIVEAPGSNTRDLYYSSQWQVLEERLNGVSTATVQYVWSPVYVHALVLRDRSTQNNGTLDERVWVQQDANWNVTAVANGSGAVVERYADDPYGKVMVLTPSWTPLGASAFAWIYLHQGGRYDTSSGLYYFRGRDYSPTLERWVQVDPLKFATGDSDLYRVERDRPTSMLDPMGLFVGPAVGGGIGLGSLGFGGLALAIGLGEAAVVLNIGGSTDAIAEAITGLHQKDFGPLPDPKPIPRADPVPRADPRPDPDVREETPCAGQAYPSDAELRRDVQLIHAQFGVGSLAWRKCTTAVAVLCLKSIIDRNGTRQEVYATTKDKTNPNAVATAWSLGFARIAGRQWWGVGGNQFHAEEIILNFASLFAYLRPDVRTPIAPSWQACGPESHNCRARIAATPGAVLLDPV
jgi:RHS repeat-associated protein